MKLGDVKIVDLSASVLNDELSKPEQGEYVFKSKRYVDYHGREARPNWWFRWIRNAPHNGFREVIEARANGYSFVQNGVDPYWPEGGVLDGNGHYVFSDTVLMKRPLAMELEVRYENLVLSKGMAQGKVNAFKSGLAAEGANVPSGLIDELIGA